MFNALYGNLVQVCECWKHNATDSFFSFENEKINNYVVIYQVVFTYVVTCQLSDMGCSLFILKYITMWLLNFAT